MSDCNSGRGWSPLQEELKAQARAAEETQVSSTPESPVDPQGNQGPESPADEQTVTEVAPVVAPVNIQEQVEKTNTVPLDALPDSALVELAAKHSVSVENKTREAVQQELTALGVTSVSL